MGKGSPILKMDGGRAIVIGNDPTGGTLPQAFRKDVGDPGSIGGDSIQSQQYSIDSNVDGNRYDQWLGATTLRPPYDPGKLIMLVDQSNAIRQCVDSYVQNIDGTGSNITGIVDLDGPTAPAVVSDAMYAEALDDWDKRYPSGKDSRGNDAPLPDLPSETDVQKRLDALRQEIHRERLRAEAFIASCCIEFPFEELRRRTRTDLEFTGTGYWEIMRDSLNRIRRVKHAPSVFMRLGPQSRAVVQVEAYRQISPFKYEDYTIAVRPRTYVMAVPRGAIMHTVFFKEFGDPRVMSAKTGKMYKTMDDFMGDSKRQRDDTVPATEILQFSIYWPGTPYGVPRWTGCLPEVAGGRKASEVNFMIFDNKAIPPIIITVSGGTFGQNSSGQLQDFVERQIKGVPNFHRIIILEADPTLGPDGKPVTPKIEIHKLFDQYNHDSLFQIYAGNCIERVGSAFRLPKLLRGIVDDVNRASAYASMLFAEGQVFSPERSSFDWLFTHRILRGLGLSKIKLVSNPTQTNDPTEIVKVLIEAVDKGSVMPGELRTIMQSLFPTNVNFPTMDDWWMKIPLALAQMGIQPTETAAKGDIQGAVEKLRKLTDEIKAMGAKALTDDFRKQAADVGLVVQVVPKGMIPR